jgi:hypothetical protein
VWRLRRLLAQEVVLHIVWAFHPMSPSFSPAAFFLVFYISLAHQFSMLENFKFSIHV